MAHSTKIFKLEGKVQHYAWGGSKFLPLLLDKPNADNQPFAEYWMGAHVNAPSTVILPDGNKEPLDAFIAAQPEAILGKQVYQQFKKLPYLFKVLDVKDMLSIQVHPTKKDAEVSFAEENTKGIALNAANRNYKDDNHKPELMLALSDFWLLHGFKPAAQLKAILQATPELQFLLPVFGENNYAELYRTVMEMPQQEVNQHLLPLVRRIVPLYNEKQLRRDQEDFWAARAVHYFSNEGNIDRGTFSVYFFNLVHLKPGEAIFQDAGVPHAYLEGRNMEIMANSDNVLRGGLTPKHIDVNELLKHVKFEAITPQVIRGIPGQVPAEEKFPTPAADFELRGLSIAPGEAVLLLAQTAEVFFVYEGSVVVSNGDEKLNLKRGETFLATAGAEINIKGAQEEAIIFRATVAVE